MLGSGYARVGNDLPRDCGEKYESDDATDGGENDRKQLLVAWGGIR